MTLNLNRVRRYTFRTYCLDTKCNPFSYSNSNPLTEEDLRGDYISLEGTVKKSISDEHQDIKRAPMRFGKRAPMRFGKREFVDEPDEYQILRSARAPMRFGKRSDLSKRAPMRFGKRAPMRFGKRDFRAPSFVNNYDEYVIGGDYI